jgi:hypothetical protein
MPADEQTVMELAEQLSVVLNDAMDAGVQLNWDPLNRRYTLAAGGYADGWQHIHRVTYSDSNDYWDVERAE